MSLIEVKMADWLSVVSVLIIAFAFLSLGMFISRLGVLEARAFVGSALPSTRDIPAKSLVEVRNPFVVNLVDPSCPFRKGIVSFLLSNVVHCYVTAYWGVPTVSIDKVLTREQDNLQSSDDDEDDYEDDYDNKEWDFNQMVPFHRVLSGSYDSKSSMEYYNPGHKQAVDIQIPTEYKTHLEKICTQKENDTFPMVFVVERSRNLSPEEKKTVKSSDIVTLITALCCSKYSTDSTIFSVFTQYIQIANGNIFPLKKLYVSDSHSSQSNVTLSDDTIDTAVPSATCVVCHSMSVSRVLLPCRHACVCGLCFSKLQAKCPMCRQWIQSYFATGEEPDLTTNELETSRELNEMSASEILRGMFRAN